MLRFHSRNWKRAKRSSRIGRLKLSARHYSRDFDEDALPHLSSAYNLARWLTRNEQDAEDIVQEAYLRAFRFHHRFRGGDARPWLLKIVRNTYYAWLDQNSEQKRFDAGAELVRRDLYTADPESITIQNSNCALLRRALETLPTGAREVLILRELWGMSYKEISIIVGVPTGTVMSRLSRARGRLRQTVTDLMNAKADVEGFD